MTAKEPGECSLFSGWPFAQLILLLWEKKMNTEGGFKSQPQLKSSTICVCDTILSTGRQHELLKTRTEKISLK